MAKTQAQRKAEFLAKHTDLTSTDFDWYAGRFKDYKIDLKNQFDDLLKHGTDHIDDADLAILIATLNQVINTLKVEQVGRG